MKKQILLATIVLAAYAVARAQTPVLLDGQPAVRCDGQLFGPLTIYRTVKDSKPSFHANALEINGGSLQNRVLTIAADTVTVADKSGHSFTVERRDLAWGKMTPSGPRMTLTENGHTRQFHFATDNWNKPLHAYSACIELAQELIVAFPDGAAEFDRLIAPLTASRQLPTEPLKPTVAAVEPPKSTIAVLKITSHPGSAQVYLDGIFKGQTDDDGSLLVESTAGDHDLRIDHADYKEWKGKVTLSGEQTERSIDLVKRGPKPLSVDEVEQALSQGITPGRCAELVREYGVDFAVTPEIDKRLRDKGADSDLLVAIAENKR